MKKIFILSIFACLFLCGCTTLKDMSIEEVINYLSTQNTEDILYDVIPLSIMFQAFETDEKNSWIDLDDSEYAEIRPIGTVKYSEFVKGLELLGYDVSLKTFDEFFTEACGLCHGSKIVIDFAKEKKHTL